MRKLINVALSALLISAFSLSTVVLKAEAASKVTEFKNCTELNKYYQGGVAMSSSVKNKGGKTKYKPFASKDLYEANKKSDRDKDLIACER
ncbi:excalibur calcium-binding domain-containing protein [Paenibacillus sp. GCM10023252]|uniref:excalibur calcium-binding domain-containing protein n=1 Tax=Paenibacillus sp. GCM10023252 TaxID=3252649 RepID=UPI00361B086D